MRASERGAALPSDDKRWKVVRSAMRRNGYRPDALIETLHSVQEVFGYLDETAFEYVANSLRVPLSQVYGVASFYHYFKLEPPGEHTCVVCMGTACHIKGAPKINDAVDEAFGIKPGQTSEDNKLTLISARCVGACGIAPVVIMDGEYKGKITPEDVVKQMREWKKQ